MKEIKQLVREVVPVILGILIALAVNNWNETRKDKRYLEQIYTSINNELEESRIEIKESIPKQQILIDSIGRYMNDETVAIFDIIRKADGIQGPRIKNNAWKAIAGSKIELVEFEKLSALSEIDQSKEGIELKTDKLIDFLVNNLKSTSQEKKEIFMLLSQEILSTVKYSLSEIEEFLEKENALVKPN